MRELTYAFCFDGFRHCPIRFGAPTIRKAFYRSIELDSTLRLLVLDAEIDPMQTGQYSTSQFARDVDTYVRKYPNESEVLRQIKPLLEKLIRSTGSVSAEAFTPRKDRVAMNLIHMPSDEAFSIIGGGWHPRQTTPIHG